MEKIIEEKEVYGDLDLPEVTIERGELVARMVMVPKETPKGVGFIDQLSFTFNDDFETNFQLRRFAAKHGGGIGEITDEGVITRQVAAILAYVFGLEVGAKRPAGLNFYKDTWSLTEGCGMVSIGGQKGTILVQITGQGMACAREGWQGRFKQLIKIANRLVFTRVDLAFDDLQGQHYSVDRAVQDYKDNRFTARGRPPSCEQRGNWIRPDGKGRTFYVGRRENGKMLRVYEKGRQLGDSDSEWVRVELELHNADRIIPYDVLDRPGAYLCGSYVALDWMQAAEGVERIATLRKVAAITYDNLIGHLRRSYGGLIRVVLECEESALSFFVSMSRHRPLPRRLDLALMPLVPA